MAQPPSDGEVAALSSVWKRYAPGTASTQAIGAAYVRCARRSPWCLEAQFINVLWHAGQYGVFIPWELVYAETGSGLAARPALTSLLDDARRGYFGTVVIANRSRLAPNMRILELTLRKFGELGLTILVESPETSPSRRA